MLDAANTPSLTSSADALKTCLPSGRRRGTWLTTNKPS